ncbi:RNA 2',3'-cyclic phosphodiesterase [Bradymonas sediminis]|uniref:RNA 2',3'-cyclic phosphodiesterase n=1 Tax=Bradymonas sediminis TaxID=1548548 RepID=A0A2Z4FJ16_9DELT|nr:RNA 2',3'-cyclic phosphodiesterase [Bradymonas sediminis]AWV89021.1 RNA 2',3'-cyclic phosphodiesterase [Bradymonas sediminis]TDP64520.1 2'-5' RNA ligase [Bradymonas sediminis]
MRRLFVALDLAIGVVEELLNIQEEFHAYLDANGDLPQTRMRWTHPENIHLTLKFLGDTDDALVSRLSDTISGLVKPLFPFEVETKGLGFFPAPELPRIFWCGFAPESAEVLALLQQAIERDLGELGFEPNERAFHPHITLGRVKSRANPNFAKFAQKYENKSFGKSYVKDFVLYESILTPKGPVYQVVERFTLGA